MSNVNVRVRAIYAGEFAGIPIAFNGTEYRIRFMGRVYRAYTLSALRNGLAGLFV